MGLGQGWGLVGAVVDSGGGVAGSVVVGGCLTMGLRWEGLHGAGRGSARVLELVGRLKLRR